MLDSVYVIRFILAHALQLVKSFSNFFGGCQSGWEVEAHLPHDNSARALLLVLKLCLPVPVPCPLAQRQGRRWVRGG